MALQFHLPLRPLGLQVREPQQRALRYRRTGSIDDIQQETELSGQHGFPGILVLVGLVQHLVDLPVPGGNALHRSGAGLLQVLVPGVFRHQRFDLALCLACHIQAAQTVVEQSAHFCQAIRTRTGSPRLSALMRWSIFTEKDTVCTESPMESRAL